MKKDRNCGGMGYNQALPFVGVQPPMMVPQPYTPYNTTYTQTYNNVENQINNMQQQLNNLENRVAKLESKTNTAYNNKYSDSNYYML